MITWLPVTMTAPQASQISRDNRAETAFQKTKHQQQHTFLKKM